MYFFIQTRGHDLISHIFNKKVWIFLKKKMNTSTKEVWTCFHEKIHTFFVHKNNHTFCSGISFLGFEDEYLINRYCPYFMKKSILFQEVGLVCIIFVLGLK